MGATMPPEGKDNLKGQACLGCKRNGMRTLVHSGWAAGAPRYCSPSAFCALADVAGPGMAWDARETGGSNSLNYKSRHSSLYRKLIARRGDGMGKDVIS